MTHRDPTVWGARTEYGCPSPLQRRASPAVSPTGPIPWPHAGTGSSSSEHQLSIFWLRIPKSAPGKRHYVKPSQSSRLFMGFACSDQ